jgi:hypothetical protein
MTTSPQVPAVTDGRTARFEILLVVHVTSASTKSSGNPEAFHLLDLSCLADLNGWTDARADARSARQARQKIAPSENQNTWQSGSMCCM